MSLHVEVTGRGEPIVMLHGWGMHGGVWRETVAQLASDFEVHVVDLPGHGASKLDGTFELDAVVDVLAARFLAPVSVLGWSLGGIIAQRWAMRSPETIKRLVLVASTPCFAERTDWQFGMPQDTLQHFANELGMNHAATLRRFLALQVRGSEGEREILATLRESLFNRGEPDMAALLGGLDILRDADLREQLPQIGAPTLAIAGERDKLTPPQASHYVAEAVPNARAVEIKGAAHAPFLSHPQVFVEQIKSFLNE